MKRKRKLKTYIRLITIFIIFIIFLILSLFMICFSSNIDKNNYKSILKYDIINNLDYKVYLKNNNYFSNNVLPKDEQYIANIVESIKPSYDYIFNADKKFNYTYSYKIIGTLTANHNIDNDNNKKVWEKEYTFKDLTTKEMKNSSGFVIKENINIDFQKFSEYIQEFKKDYTLSINSNLNVSMTVNIIGKIKDKEITKNSKISMDIPLSEQSFGITTDYKKIENDEIKSNKNMSNIKNIYLILGFTILIISNIILIIDSINIYKYNSTHKKYSKELNKILSAYKDILVSSKELVDLEDYKVIDIVEFQDLLDVEQELRIPIIYKEVVEDKETWFIIINNDQAWRYILNNNSL